MAKKKDKNIPTDGSRFLQDWMKKGQSPQHLAKNAIVHDKWDDQDYHRLLKEMVELHASEDRITDQITTGAPLFADGYFSLSKADPHLEKAGDVRPSHLINRAVMEEAMKLHEWDELRSYCAGDEIGAALADVAMEPDFETLYDRLQQEQKLAQELAKREDALEGAEKTAEELMNDLINMDPNDPNQGQKQKDFQQNEELINQLREQLAAGAQDLQDQLEKRAPSIKSQIKQAINKGLDEVAGTEMMSLSWGLERGALQRMDPKERMELARRMNNPRLKRIAELIGPMSRLAFAEQMRKTTTAQDEVYDLSLGDDLARVLPMELLGIKNRYRKLDFFRRLLEGQLLQYELRGEERVAKGGLYICEDGSGSMSGDREMWAKAVSLVLMHIARSQKRAWFGVHFGSPGEFFCKDFRDWNDISFEGVMEWAETFWGGGPLRVDQRVVTPKGWKPIGEIQVGDEVFTPDGFTTRVLGVFPQGVLDLYKLTFNDGASVICDGTHRWTTLAVGATPRKTLTVNEMLKTGLYKEYHYDRQPGGNKQYRYRIPTTAPIELPARDLPLDPYLMGTLLGDGSMCGTIPRITAEGSDLPWVVTLPEHMTYKNYEKRPGFCPMYGLSALPTCPISPGNPVKRALVDLGIWGLTDDDKYIPDDYLWGSVEQRWALLQGLLDTDGNYSKPGRAEFGNISEKLIEGVVQLVQSLGGAATVSERTVRENERPFFRVQIRLNQADAPFRLKRKAEKWKRRHTPWTRSIVSIEPTLSAEAVCIKIDHDDGLFLTEGFAATHNTDFVTPLSVCLTLLQEEYKEKGAVNGDIVFITDGQCGVPPEWLESFKEEQKKLGFRIFGVVIGGSVTDEPLRTICDGRVFNIKDLQSGEELRDVFRVL